MEADKEIFLKSFGGHLKELRTKYGLSTIEMAKRMFMDSGNYTRLETGKTNPTIYTLKKFCKVLDINLEQLMKNFED
ncbi:MAG: helix-turn-helix transcriptional regulator [Ekhidna sp.]